MIHLTREQRVAHRFLSTYDMAFDRLASSITALERAESSLKSVTGSIEAMGLSGSQTDKLALALSRLDEAIEAINESSKDYALRFHDVEQVVSEVQRVNEKAGKVLRMTYIDRASVADIAYSKQMGCSKKTVYEYMRSGLDIAFEVLSEEEL